MYIDDNNQIQWRSYTKPTDAKRYLRPQSFHPKNVFTSVPTSQMIRTIERNSDENVEKTEMKKLIHDFEQSGYKREELEKIEQQTRGRLQNPDESIEERDILTFPVHFFDGIKTLKQIINDSEDDLQSVIGDTKIVMAIKKNPSIGSNVVRNKGLSTEETHFVDQKCGGPGCEQCPLVNTDPITRVNNMIIKPNTTLNCKSRNVIYLWQCLLCRDDDSYFGRTVQKSHLRTNGHRGCFNETKWEDSALSMHARCTHGENFDLKNFRITLVKKCSPQNIRREEFKYIDKYRTRVKGINRYKN